MSFNPTGSPRSGSARRRSGSLRASARAWSIARCVNAPTSSSRAAIAAAQRSTTPSGVSSPASMRRARSRAESRRSGRESMVGFLLLAHGSKEDGHAKLEIVGSVIQSALSSGLASMLDYFRQVSVFDSALALFLILGINWALTLIHVL